MAGDFTSIDDWRTELHEAGVHVRCKLAPLASGSRARHASDGTWRKCPHAGKVERFHSHDFDGSLVCGCPDFGT
jgi:hypothetical protein